MLIPQLSVGTYVVVFKLIRLLDTPIVYLILWLAFLFVPWWYICHILSIRRHDRCWVIEFVFVGYWFVSLVIPCIHSANEYYIVFEYCWFVTSWCGYLIPKLHTPIEVRDMFCDLLVSVFFYDFGLIAVWMSLCVLHLVCNVFAWVFTGMSSFEDYFDYEILQCLSRSI